MLILKIFSFLDEFLQIWLISKFILNDIEKNRIIRRFLNSYLLNLAELSLVVAQGQSTGYQKRIKFTNNDLLYHLANHYTTWTPRLLNNYLASWSSSFCSQIWALKENI